MAPPRAESQTLRDLFGEDLDEEVDYESGTEFLGPNESPLTTITGKDDNIRAPSVFLYVMLRTRLQRYAPRLT